MKLPLLLAVAGCLAVPAHADLSYVQTATSAFGNMMPGGGAMKTKVWFKGGSTRSESAGFGNQTIVVTRVGGSSIQIDPKSKTYAIFPSAASAVRGMMPAGAPNNMTVSVKKLGSEKIRGINAPHWRVNMLMKVKTPGGTQPMNMATDVWGSTTPLPTQANSSSQQLPAAMKTMFGNNFKIKGDLKSMGAAYRTVPLRMKMSMNGNTLTTIETTNISTKTLPASLFNVPAGYKKISSAEWTKRQQAAMRKMMQGMMKKMPRPQR
jgi:hypothetical protein